FSSRRRHTRSTRDWSSDVCSSDLAILVALGIAIGAGVSLWASMFVAALLYGLQPRDPVTLAAASATLAAVSGFAGWLPAHRASRSEERRVGEGCRAGGSTKHRARN